MLYTDLQKKISECKENHIIQFTLLENRSICLYKQQVYIKNENLLIISRAPVEYFIPLERIKSINIFEFKLSVSSLSGEVASLLYYDAIKKCYILGYARKLVAFHGSSEGLAFYDHLNFRKGSFEEGTFLYCDWDYFEKTSSWIESIGGSSPLFGVSFGWKNNLQKYIEKKMAKKSPSINTVACKNRSTLRGYISIIQVYYIQEMDCMSHGNFIQKEYETLKMDGKTWIGAIISNEVLNSNTTDKLEWTVVYFIEDFFMVPLKLINMSDKNVCIYGEVIKCNIHTEIGDCNCFKKVRSMIAE